MTVSEELAELRRDIAAMKKILEMTEEQTELLRELVEINRKGVSFIETTNRKLGGLFHAANGG